MEESSSHSSIASDLEPVDSLGESSISESESSECLSNISLNLDNIRSQLANWVHETRTSATHVNSLLKILRQYDRTLPLDCRTLCHTPRKAVVAFDENGSTYKFSGFLNNLHTFLNMNWSTAKTKSVLNIDFNVDGVGVAISSTTSLWWPLLMNVVGYYNIYMVACHCGTAKPTDFKLFLSDFVQELEYLLETGFIYNKIKFTVRIRSFSCDAPARADVLNIFHHAGYEPCHKCKIRAKRRFRRQTFGSLNSEPRTGQEFLLKESANHYHGASAMDIENLNIPAIFTIDYMHAVLLGVTKQILNLFIYDRKQPYSL